MNGLGIGFALGFEPLGQRLPGPVTTRTLKSRHWEGQGSRGKKSPLNDCFGLGVLGYDSILPVRHRLGSLFEGIVPHVRIQGAHLLAVVANQFHDDGLRNTRFFEPSDRCVSKAVE